MPPGLQPGQPCYRRASIAGLGRRGAPCPGRRGLLRKPGTATLSKWSSPEILRAVVTPSSWTSAAKEGTRMRNGETPRRPESSCTFPRARSLARPVRRRLEPVTRRQNPSGRRKRTANQPQVDLAGVNGGANRRLSFEYQMPSTVRAFQPSSCCWVWGPRASRRAVAGRSRKPGLPGTRRPRPVSSRVRRGYLFSSSHAVPRYPRKELCQRKSMI